jgi:hypothetical protein
MVHVRFYPRLHSPSLGRPAGVSPAVAILAGSLALLALGCGGRTSLDLGDGLDFADAGADVVRTAEASPDVAPEAAPAPVHPHMTESPPATTPPPDPCADKPPIPCSGGGYQYCVAGHYSECPKRCAACIPGSTRVCFLSYCQAWGVQTCTADGLAFGVCQESSVPARCSGAADGNKATPALEQCCIDSGNCCEDTFDLNGNGSTSDMLGNCSGTTC